MALIVNVYAAIERCLILVHQMLAVRLVGGPTVALTPT